MKNLLNPKWIFVINTLPVIVLFFIFISQYNIIKTLLNEESIMLWNKFGLGLGIISLLNFAYALYLTLKKQKPGIIYAIISMISYITYIYLYGYNVDKIIPFSIPNWMLSDNIFIYVGTFLMPTLIYSLMVLVINFTSDNKRHKSWLNFVIAILIPLLVYLFSILSRYIISSSINEHLIAIVFIIISILFLFFLVRSIYIIVKKKSEIWLKYQLAWKIPITLIFPLMGLALNNGLIFKDFSGSGYIFGDFSSYWFYILAVINATLICLPEFTNKIYRFAIFAAKSISFAFTLYFFIVFLPFFPFSIIAIIIFGAGFLMLTPLALFVIHVNELSKDFVHLQNYYSKKLLLIISALCFLLIPTIITIDFKADKKILNESLDYVYNTDYSKSYNINKKSVQRTIETLKTRKNRNRDIIVFNKEIPYISSYYNWLVLDNLTISTDKINKLDNIFTGTYSNTRNADNINNNTKDSVRISNIHSQSSYDSINNLWTSNVDIELTNYDTIVWNPEYSTVINLPEACWISDYYLYVGDKKEMGILAEKRSAMWIYSQIVNTNRDPGILYYLKGNKVGFRVFPFLKSEVRKTGIEFIHKEPVTLNIDNNILELGNTNQTTSNNYYEDENIIYLPASMKEDLNLIKRKPYFHFIINTSENKYEYSNEFVNRIEKLAAQNSNYMQNAKISFVNTYTNTIDFDNNWKNNYNKCKFEGGFFLDMAIRKILVESYNKKDYTYPLIIVVTDNLNQAIIDYNYYDLKIAFPESNLFYSLNENAQITTHSLISNPTNILNDTILFNPDYSVFEYKYDKNSVAFLANNNQPEIILKKDVFEISEKDINEKDWISGLKMQAMWTSLILHPEISNKEWLNLVKYSFKSKLMCPLTSYLVVENEAQKAMLQKKQDEVLSGNKSLDTNDEVQRMDEPGIFILGLLFIFVLLYLKRKKLLNT